MAYTIQAEIIRSNRKTMAIEVRPDGKVLVRAPYRVPESEIRRFLRDKEEWLKKAIEKQKAREDAAKKELSSLPPPLTAAELRALAEAAAKDLPARAERLAPLVGVRYGNITIRNQRSRWGSCSAKGNLNFNCLLMLIPEDVRDYVVVHELCHRIEMNHSPRFWSEVARVLPDYAVRKKWLNDHGSTVMRRMTGR